MKKIVYPTDDDGYIDADTAAQILGIESKSVYRIYHRGRIRGAVIDEPYTREHGGGPVIWYVRDDVLAYAADRLRPGVRTTKKRIR